MSISSALSSSSVLSHGCGAQVDKEKETGIARTSTTKSRHMQQPAKVSFGSLKQGAGGDEATGSRLGSAKVGAMKTRKRSSKCTPTASVASQTDTPASTPFWQIPAPDLHRILNLREIIVLRDRNTSGALGLMSTSTSTFQPPPSCALHALLAMAANIALALHVIDESQTYPLERGFEEKTVQ